MDTVISKLTESGLSEKEAAIYHASLMLGPTTVLKLSHRANLKRATVYTVIDDLIRKGLMRTEEIGLKKKYVSEDPINLERVMEKKMLSLKSVVPDLVVLYKKSGKSKTIKTYEGKAALENITARLMHETRTGDHRYFIGGDIGWSDVDESVQKKYFTWRERIAIDAKLLFQESERAELHKQKSKLLRQEVRVLPKKMKLASDIIITPHILVLTKMSEPISAVVIEDEDIIQTYKELFLFMWDMSQ